MPLSAAIASLALWLTLQAAAMAEPLTAKSKADPLPIGEAAKEWTVSNWINLDSTSKDNDKEKVKSLTLKDLKGKVVLVRWFTSQECPYCKATAPALNDFHEAYAARGLQVIGFYHHKGQGPMPAAKPAETAKAYDLKFPTATDVKWKTLRSWYLDGHKRNWTSVSFLIDRKGVIRHVHPGGKYVKGDADYDAMKKKIEGLLTESP